MNFTDNKIKKIVFLCMSCDIDFFIEEETYIKNTWAKSILNNEYENIDLFFYTGNSDKTYLDKDNHKIYLNCADDWYSTFTKTQLAIKFLLDNNIKFDYIVRTNLSVYVNVNMLNILAFHADTNDNIMWCLELAKSEDFIYPSGKFLVFNKYIANLIVNSSSDIHNADDYIIGSILCDNNIQCKPFETIYFNYIPFHPYYKNINKIQVSDIRHLLCMSVRKVSDDYEERKNIEYTSLKILDTVVNSYDISENDVKHCIFYQQTMIYDVINNIWINV